MNSERITILLEEYKQLFGLCNRLISVCLQLLYLALSVFGALALVSTVHQVAFGLAVAFGVTILVGYSGFIQSMLSGLTVRIVELEITMNELAGFSAGEGMKWHTATSAEFGVPFPGWRAHLTVTCIVGVLILATGLCQFWTGSTTQSLFMRCVLVITPPALITASCVCMFKAELRTRRLKHELLQQHRSIASGALGNDTNRPA